MPTNYTDKIGFFDYHNTLSAQSHNGIEGYIKLLNDGLGVFTSDAYKPTSMTTLWDSVNSQFDFSELDVGDMVDIRVDLDITTESATQDVSVKLVLGIGGSPYDIELDFISPKTAGNYKVVSYTGIYMGDANTRDNPGEIQLDTDSSITSGIVVNGWYCKVVRR